MLNKPPKEVSRAFHSLRGNPDFETVFDWLKDQLAERRKDSALIIDIAQLRRSQGSALTLDALVEQVEKSDEQGR